MIYPVSSNVYSVLKDTESFLCQLLINNYTFCKAKQPFYIDKTTNYEKNNVSIRDIYFIPCIGIM